MLCYIYVIHMTYNIRPMLDKLSTISIMSDKSSCICACPMYMHQYITWKLPTKSLDACTQTYTETSKELCHHVTMADADHQLNSSFGPCVCLKWASCTIVLVLCLLNAHTQGLRGKLQSNPKILKWDPPTNQFNQKYWESNPPWESHLKSINSFMFQ